MPILISPNILRNIDKEIKQCQDSFCVISAYCKETLIRYFDAVLPESVRNKKLIVRLRPDDILKGSTDLSIYPYCKENGWEIRFKLDLHAKTYVFDNLRCIVGSANATGSGLCVGGIGNYEMATACKIDDADVRLIDSLFTSSPLMNDEIYELMKKTLEQVDTANDMFDVKWPSEILDLQCPDYSVLFAEDFPQGLDPFDDGKDELGFLVSDWSENVSDIRSQLEVSKCYLWLKNVLIEKDNHEIYFGEATAKLHDVLLDDPKPYRKEVKELLANLLSWIEKLECKEIVIDRPNYSQRIRLKEMRK